MKQILPALIVLAFTEPYVAPVYTHPQYPYYPPQVSYPAPVVHQPINNFRPMPVAAPRPVPQVPTPTWSR